MELKQCTLTVITEDKPGVLYRIADTFLKRKINITSLHVSKMEEDNLSHFTIVFDATNPATEQIMKQLDKIIEVIKVTKQ